MLTYAVDTGRTALRRVLRYGFSSIGYTFLLAALAIQVQPCLSMNRRVGTEVGVVA